MTVGFERTASPIAAEVVRITAVDQCGLPITGASSAQCVIDTFTEVSNKPNYEKGQRFLLKKASGAPCVNTMQASFLNWIEQQVTMCTVDPDVLTIVTGNRLLSDGVTGTGMVGDGDLTLGHFSLELWQPTDACQGDTQQFMYWAFPNMYSAEIQQFDFKLDTFTFSWSAMTKRANTSWALGNAWLNGANAFIEVNDHYAFNVTTVVPPTPYVGAATLP